MIALATNKQENVVCIVCPVGCQMVGTLKDGIWVIEGNRCKRGERYGVAELENPLRMVTGSVRVEGGRYPLVSVKTDFPVPKAEVIHIAKKMKMITVRAPISIGDVVIASVSSNGVNLVATRHVEEWT